MLELGFRTSVSLRIDVAAAAAEGPTHSVMDLKILRTPTV